MNTKRTLIALAATGGVAALAFGGTAVVTGWTSNAGGTVSVSNAKVGTTIANGNFTLTNALPGDTTTNPDVQVTNNGTTKSTLVLSVSAGSSPLMDQYLDVLYNGTKVGTVKSLEATPYPLGPVASGDSFGPFNVQVQLDPNTPVSYAGASDTVSYLVTGTASH